MTNPDNVGGLLPCPRCKSDGERSVTARHLDYDVLLVRCDQCQWATAVTEWDRHTSKSVTEIWNSAVMASSVLTADTAKALPDGSMDESSFQAIEDALDAVEAPMRGESGKWLTLAERVRAYGELCRAAPAGGDDLRSLLKSKIAGWRDDAVRHRRLAAKMQQRGDDVAADVNFTFAQGSEASADELEEMLTKTDGATQQTGDVKLSDHRGFKSFRIEAPDDLHEDTVWLVAGFAMAMAQKLAKAQRKYGHTNNWQRDDWMDECRIHLRQHVEKGDPLDVAAYCAFLWHHGESTSTGQTSDARDVIDTPTCYSIDGDSWFDCPEDSYFVGGRNVGDEFTLEESHWSRPVRFRVTKVPDDVSDDYEVERIGPIKKDSSHD